MSTHGNDEGIALCSDVRGGKLPEGYEWDGFVDLFQGPHDAPKALVMSACNGAAKGLAIAFSKVSKRPGNHLGSTDERPPADCVAAWALLYRRFRRSGITRPAAQRALGDICAVVHGTFRYLRRDGDRERYLRFPGTEAQFDVMERE